MRWLAILLLCGCNEGALSPNNNLQDDFCSSTAKLELNGQLAKSPSVSQVPLFLDCCEAGAVQFVSMQLSSTLRLVWRAQVGSQPGIPATIDVAKPPAGWGVSLSSDCDDVGRCSDTLSDGMTGSLTVSGDFSTGFTTSACITAKETTTHPVIHSARLWIP